MFINFTDTEGRETWVNPLHVKVVRTYQGLLGGKKGTEIWFSFNNHSEAIHVPQTPAEVAALMDAAMPPVVLLGSDEEGGAMPGGHGGMPPVH